MLVFVVAKKKNRNNPTPHPSPLPFGFFLLPSPPPPPHIPLTHTPILQELAYGFLRVANEAMCRPIRNLTQMRGYDIASHKMAVFGGAGPQHACAMAGALGMSTVFVHRYGGILSAYGLSMADAVTEEQEPAADVYCRSVDARARADADVKIDDDEKADLSKESREERLGSLAERATRALVKQGYAAEDVVVEKFVVSRAEGRGRRRASEGGGGRRAEMPRMRQARAAPHFLGGAGGAQRGRLSSSSAYFF